MPMQKKTSDILKYSLWVAIAVALVYFSLRSVDWGEFWSAMQQCRWGYVLVSMALGLLVFYIRSLRWRMQLLPIDPTTSRVTTFNAYNICMGVNLVLPRVGEVVRGGYVAAHSSVDEKGNRRVGVDKAIGTVVADRVWDAVSMMVIAVIIAFTMWDRIGSFFTDSLSGAVTSRLNLIWILLVLAVVAGGYLFLSWRLKDKGGFWGKNWSLLKGVWDGLVSCFKMKNSWLFIVYTVMIWVLYWMMSWCCVVALSGVDAFSTLTVADALFLMFAGSVSTVIPVPGGFGAYHAVVAGALSSFWGIPFGTAMIYATLAHESQAVVAALAGIGSYIHETFVRKH